MKTYLNINYYEVGDEVIQDSYPGCPAVIDEIEDTQFRNGQTIYYRIKIDATGHPEAFDENGEPENIKYCGATRERLDLLNQEKNNGIT